MDSQCSINLSSYQYCVTTLFNKTLVRNHASVLRNHHLLSDMRLKCQMPMARALGVEGQRICRILCLIELRCEPALMFNVSSFTGKALCGRL